MGLDGGMALILWPIAAGLNHVLPRRWPALADRAGCSHWLSSGVEPFAVVRRSHGSRVAIRACGMCDHSRVTSKGTEPNVGQPGTEPGAMTAPLAPATPGPGHSTKAVLTLGALGVVFGDILSLIHISEPTRLGMI